MSLWLWLPTGLILWIAGKRLVIPATSKEPVYAVSVCSLSICVYALCVYLCLLVTIHLLYLSLHLYICPVSVSLYTL